MPVYPQNILKIPPPPFLGGAFWGAGGRAWALSPFAGSVRSAGWGVEKMKKVFIFHKLFPPLSSLVLP